MIAVMIISLGNAADPMKMDTVFAADTGNDAAGAAQSDTDSNSPGALPPEEGANNSAMLSLDNRNCYEGMTGAYSDGYVPVSKDGYMNVVLPLLCDGALRNNELRVSADLGDALGMPFVCKNYEKTVSCAEHKVNQGKGSVSGYLISFRLELSKDRVNGNYPVMLHVSGTDEGGVPVTADYTVYVIVRDGIDPNAKAPEPAAPAPKEEPVIYTPKVLVKSYTSTKKDAGGDDFIAAGDMWTLKIVLWNTSEKELLKNASASITSPPEGFTLLSPSNAVYLGDFKAGETKEISFEYQAGVSVLPGQYDFGITCEYAYGKGAVSTDSGTAKAVIGEHLNVQFDNLQIPQEVTVSDTVTASLQAMNLGKTAVYNVRAVIEGDGLNPGGTLFIGTIDPGTAASSSIQVTISGLTESSVLYGDTKGHITYYYEDANGKEYSEEREFGVTVKSPFSDQSVKPEDSPGQWWIIMGIVGGVILLLLIVFVVRYVKRRKEYDEMVE